MTDTQTGAVRSPSPPTRRVVEILTLLAGAAEPLPVAAIAERLGIARATATAVLAELDLAGWAVRVPDRGYRLGPGLLTLTGPLLPPEIGDILQELATEAGCGATLSRIEPDALTVLDVRHGPDRMVPGIPVGHRIPLRFPAGAAVMPWRPAAEQNTWLATTADADRRTAGALLTLVKDRGVAVFRPRSDDAGTVDLLADLLAAVGTELLHPHLRTRALRQLTALTARPFTRHELDGDEQLPLSYLAAPVFDGAGTAAYEVQLGPLRATTTRADRDRYIAITLAAARALTAALSG
ncbi:DNA-binding transcriptional regulator, IclR family [Nocardia farcinica]|uniref:IclR helix-turn-helix domain n=2 Tax=Nocardia farcinica TaxID=37329 RepID=A0A0H5NLG1_NOCFR|nr:helix-turn-helix domain-containing protein [Nocardia farcinica]AXK85012.1 MarR family transcriptional regulator [Nocardia farcinica]MBF6067697.1 helix-turn-helix domain-containing protein [Nocardia farcinica]MBF6359322.1 helix-turn-helix domain-containing protein [Nocardia farcinica]MBF6441575.1 helix-turn-helix domain-containing protein [Nocardia farcinica]CRY76007.1 IclR helix-turn-helix domain [Nocardia farcinica]